MKKIVLGVAALLLIATAVPTSQVWADSQDSQTTAIDERWGKPTFVAGAGLSQSQIDETMKLLGITKDEVKSDTATGADLIHYLGSGSGDDSAMISSVVVKREDKGKGINVEIVTPKNITVITADQYKNPLVTAGITDATVKVASVVPVTGESALTGVYKAFQVNGETVDADRAQLAQDELDTTTEVSSNIIDKANSENSDLSADEKAKAEEAWKAQVSQALVDIKKELAEIKEKQGELATKADIEKIVNDALAKNNLSQYASEADVQKLTTLAEGYQSTDGVLDKESLAQLDKISEGFKDTVNQLGDQLGSFGEKLEGTLQDNQGFFANLWQGIQDFFRGLGNWFSNLF